MNVPRCALGICIVIKLSPPSLIRQHRRIPSRRQSASRLPSPRRTTNTPFRAISSERERERERARSGWGCVTPCLPLTDGRTDGQAPRFLTAVITTSCHVQSHSWFWQPQSCRPYRCIFRCHESRRKVLDHQWLIFLEVELNFLHQCRYNYLVNVNKSTKGGY